jgi:hypothetical protein
MNDKEKKSVEAERNIDVEIERLKLDKRRLNLDIEAHESSKKLNTESIALDKSKEWTTKLQIGLPVFLSILALAFSFISEDRRTKVAQALQQRQFEEQYNLMVNSYKEGRLELFRRMSEHVTDGAEIKKIYADIFPRDSIVLQGEQLTVKAGGK